MDSAYCITKLTRPAPKIRQERECEPHGAWSRETSRSSGRRTSSGNGSRRCVMRRQAIVAALALLAAGAAQAAVTEFIIYKQPDFKGPSQVVKGEVNILENGFAREGESLVVHGGYWEACTE